MKKKNLRKGAKKQIKNEEIKKNRYYIEKDLKKRRNLKKNIARKLKKQKKFKKTKKKSEKNGKNAEKRREKIKKIFQKK